MPGPVEAEAASGRISRRRPDSIRSRVQEYLGRGLKKMHRPGCMELVLRIPGFALWSERRAVPAVQHLGFRRGWFHTDYCNESFLHRLQPRSYRCADFGRELNRRMEQILMELAVYNTVGSSSGTLAEPKEAI